MVNHQYRVADEKQKPGTASKSATSLTPSCSNSYHCAKHTLSITSKDLDKTQTRAIDAAHVV